MLHALKRYRVETNLKLIGDPNLGRNPGVKKNCWCNEIVCGWVYSDITSMALFMAYNCLDVYNATVVEVFEKLSQLHHMGCDLM